MAIYFIEIYIENRWLDGSSHSLNENIFDFIHDMDRKEMRYNHVEFVQWNAHDKGNVCSICSRSTHTEGSNRDAITNTLVSASYI